LGFVFRKENEDTDCYLSCDNCGYVVKEIKVFSLNIPEVTKYMRENKWFKIDCTKENNYKGKDYCNSCAIALGYIK